jgi:hypothetical protein
MDRAEHVRMAQTKTESSTTLPERVDDRTDSSLHSTSSSTGQLSFEIGGEVLIITDAEPSTSNEASFNDDDTQGVQRDRSDLRHATDLICVGSRFSEVEGEYSDVHGQVDGSLRRNRNLGQGYIARQREEEADPVEAKTLEGGVHGFQEDISGTVDTDDEIIGQPLKIGGGKKQCEKGD